MGCCCFCCSCCWWLLMGFFVSFFRFLFCFVCLFVCFVFLFVLFVLLLLTGWLGVKHQVTYLLLFCCVSGVDVFVNGEGGGGMRVLKHQCHCQDISSYVIGHVIYHWRYHLTCYILTKKKKKKKIKSLLFVVLAWPVRYCARLICESFIHVALFSSFSFLSVCKS